MLIWSRRVLRVLLVLNWAFVALFAIFLGVALSPLRDILVEALSQTLTRDQALVSVRAMAAVMALAILVGITAHILFRRMLEIVATALAGDPFTRGNAGRLRVVGWALLAIQVMDLGFGTISLLAESRTGEGLGWSPSVGGWIAALMVFVLARVFEQGARMRDELAMTV